MSKVLITGIGGFVGGHLMDALLQYRPNESYFGLHFPGLCCEHLPGSVQLHPVDITDSRILVDTLESVKPDYIVHLAAIAFVPDSSKDPLRTWEINLTASLRILEWIRKKSPESRMLVLSTSEIYGVPQYIPVDEKHPLAPNNVYSATKAALDVAAGQYLRANNLNIAIVRPFNHIGPGQSSNFVVSSFSKQVAEASLGITEPVINVGNLSAKRDFTDVRDVVKGYAHLLFSKERGVYNICSGRSVSIQTILETLAAKSDRELEIRVDQQRLRPVDVPDIRGDHTKFTAAFGWEPQISLENSLSDTLDFWLRKSHQATR